MLLFGTCKLYYNSQVNKILLISPNYYLPISKIHTRLYDVMKSFVLLHIAIWNNHTIFDNFSIAQNKPIRIRVQPALLFQARNAVGHFLPFFPCLVHITTDHLIGRGFQKPLKLRWLFEVLFSSFMSCKAIRLSPNQKSLMYHRIVLSSSLPYALPTAYTSYTVPYGAFTLIVANSNPSSVDS